MKRAFLLAAAAPALLALAACANDADDVAALEAELAANEIDPAITSAIEDPILTDPGLRQQAHATAARPPEAPVQALYPLGEGPAEPGPGACAGDFDREPQYAENLPPGLPLPPGARVEEAAGSADGHCRFLAFAADRPAEQVIDWYRSAAAKAGYVAQAHPRGADLVLVGARPDGASSFYLLVVPQGDGAEVALLHEGE